MTCLIVSFGSSVGGKKSFKSEAAVAEGVRRAVEFFTGHCRGQRLYAGPP